MANSTTTKQNLKISLDCRDKAEAHSVNCRYPGCTGKAINSHILQKNGIISTIAPDRHLWQMEVDRFGSETFIFKRRGIEQVFSFNCFCKTPNDHDAKLFKKIESGSIDFNDYDSCLRFTLRTLLNEIWIKEVNILHSECLINEIPGQIDVEVHKAKIKGDLLGIDDLKITEQLIWDDLNNGTQSFVFQHRVFPLTEICISAFYTHDTSSEINSANVQYSPADISINFFPYKGKSILIMGYRKQDETKVKGMINMMFKQSERKAQIQLTNLLLFQCETWICSDKFYKLMIKGYEKLFSDALRYTISLLNVRERRIFPINIFATNFLQKFSEWRTEHKHYF